MRKASFIPTTIRIAVRMYIYGPLSIMHRDERADRRVSYTHLHGWNSWSVDRPAHHNEVVCKLQNFSCNCSTNLVSQLVTLYYERQYLVTPVNPYLEGLQVP